MKFSSSILLAACAAALCSCDDADGVIDAHETRLILNKRKISPNQYEDRILKEAARGSVNLTRYLIWTGTNLNCRNNEGRTPLHFASVARRIDFASKLIKAKANVNAADKYGRTPLHYAAAMGQDRTLQLLVKSGANLHAKDLRRNTPFLWAIYHGQQNAARLLQKLESQPSD